MDAQLKESVNSVGGKLSKGAFRVGFVKGSRNTNDRQGDFACLEVGNAFKPYRAALYPIDGGDELCGDSKILSRGVYLALFSFASDYELTAEITPAIMGGGGVDPETGETTEPTQLMPASKAILCLPHSSKEEALARFAEYDYVFVVKHKGFFEELRNLAGRKPIDVVIS